MLLKLFMPVAIANVTNPAPQLPYYFYSQTLFWLPTTFGRVFGRYSVRILAGIPAILQKVFRG
jgi:hypothetical protein